MMDWGRFIFFKAIRVTIGFLCGVFLVWLLSVFGRGGHDFSPSGFISYFLAMWKSYPWLLVGIWLILVVIEVVRGRPRRRSSNSAGTSTR